jgi:hypothetical protein
MRRLFRKPRKEMQMITTLAQCKLGSTTLRDVRLSEWSGGAPCGVRWPEVSEGCGPEVLSVFNLMKEGCHYTISR